MNRTAMGVAVAVVAAMAAPAAAGKRPKQLAGYPSLIPADMQTRKVKVIGKRTLGGREVMVWRETGYRHAEPDDPFMVGVRSADATIEILGLADVASRELLVKLGVANTLATEGYEGPDVVTRYAYAPRFEDLDGDGADELVLVRTHAEEIVDGKAEALDLPAQVIYQVRHGDLRSVTAALARCGRVDGDAGRLDFDDVDWPAMVAGVIAELDRTSEPSRRACLFGDLVALDSETPRDPAGVVEDRLVAADPAAGATDVVIAPPEAACVAADWMARHGRASAPSRHVVYRSAEGALVARTFGPDGASLVEEIDEAASRIHAAVIDERAIVVYAPDPDRVIAIDAVTHRILVDLSGDAAGAAIEDRDGTVVITVDGVTRRYDPKLGAFRE